MDASVFRAYDIRGVVGETITADFAHRLGLVYAEVMRGRGLKQIIVGYDGRLHAPMLADALCLGLSQGGVDVLNIGVGPTPMTYFATYATDARCAIMVTGSHNPPEYNGFKCVMDREPFYGDDLLSLCSKMSNVHSVSDAASVKKISVQNQYVHSMMAATRLETMPQNLRCVWDPGNGAAGDVVRDLMANLPGQHTLINGSIDGTFPAHHPDPSDPHNMVQLQKAVLDAGADVGLALDGDGDRLGVVDDQGNIVSSDALLTLLARGVLRDHAGATILGDVKTSRLFFDDIEQNGGNSMIWMVGHAHIKAKMKKEAALFAGEGSGHIFFADRYFGYDDGLYAGLRLLEVVSLGKLSALVSALPVSYTSPEVRVFCPDDQKFSVIDTLRDRVQAAGATCLAIDGIRVETREGWWLVRASNTQPALSVRCESMTQQGRDHLISVLVSCLADVGLVVDRGMFEG